MTQDGGYDLVPAEKKAESPPTPATPADAGSPPTADSVPPTRTLKPGDVEWVPPVPIIEKADEEPAEEEVPVDPDVEKYRAVAVIGYIIFVIPLVSAPNSKYVRFHANQALLVFLTLVAAVVGVVALQLGLTIKDWIFRATDIGILNSFFGCGFHLLQFGLLVGWAALVVLGMIHAANGEIKELPVVGHWTLIK